MAPRGRRIAEMLAALSGRPAGSGEAIVRSSRRPDADYGSESLSLSREGKDAEYVGHFLVQGNVSIRGWAATPSRPAEAIPVSIVIDGEKIGSAVADYARPNLKQFFGEDVHHGFEAAIPRRFYDGRQHEVNVLAPDGSEIAPRRAFTIAPDAPFPEVRIIEASPDGVSGLIEVPHEMAVNRSSISIWMKGERLRPNAYRLNVEEGGGRLRKFHLSFTRLTLADLLRDDAQISLAGGYELGEGLRLRSALGVSVTRSWNNVLTISSRVLLPEDLGLGLRLAVYVDTPGGEPVITTEVDLSLGSDEVSINRTDDKNIWIAVYMEGDSAPWSKPELLQRRLGELVSDPTFRDWSDGVPRAWMLGSAASEVFHSHYAFAQEITRQYELSGDLVVVQCALPPCDPGEILRQRVPHEAIDHLGHNLVYRIAARASRSARALLEIKTGNHTLSSTSFAIGTNWCFLTQSSPVRPAAGVEGECSVSVSLTSSADPEPLWCEFAGIACGELAVFRRKSNAGASENSQENLVENPQLVRWPNGLDFSQAMGRFETAAGWFVYNKRSSVVPSVSLRPATQVPDRLPAADERYAIRVSATEVPRYCRLEIRIRGFAIEHLPEYVFDIVTCTDAHAPSARLVARPWSMIDRIYVLRRTAHEIDGGKESRDVIVANIANRILVTKNPQKFSFGSWAESRDEQSIPEGDGSYDDYIVLEFNEPFAIAVQDAELLRKRRYQSEDTTAELSFEDSNITAQIPFLEEGRYLRVLKDSGPGATPAATAAPVRRGDATAPRWSWRHREFGTVDIVICMHNAVDETLACLASLCRTTSIPHTVIVVDDASSMVAHNRVREFIEDKPWMRLVRNDENLGYTRSANRGIYASEADWVVLLNSDTVVTTGWLEGLLECAVSHEKTACVGPLSNAATYQSVPEVYDTNGMWRTNVLPSSLDVEELAGFIRENSLKVFPGVPLLNGFCTLIRREVFVELGGFNEAAFPAGYGEENDFCVRVARAGYRLALADHVYIYHHKSASFGTDRRRELAGAGNKALKELHPNIDFSALGREFGDTSALAHIRDRVRALYKVR